MVKMAPGRDMTLYHMGCEGYLCDPVSLYDHLTNGRATMGTTQGYLQWQHPATTATCGVRYFNHELHTINMSFGKHNTEPKYHC